MAKLPSLKTLLTNLSSVQVGVDRESIPVGPLCLDSRKIQSGDTFVAVEGFQNDGRVYIPTALDKGASLILAERKNNDEFKQMFSQIAKDKIIWIDNLRDNLSEIAANYYGHPSDELKNIAVTGTNGKTSCSFFDCQNSAKDEFRMLLDGNFRYW